MRIHIFCRVIDNFGDAGVCWRLARTLADRGHGVTLVIDQPELLDQLVPDRVSGGAASPGAVHVAAWQDVPPAAMADAVIEAFACDLPESYVTQMVACVRNQKQHPVWINLEYLSAESWVESHHGLASLHPTLPLKKYFFFPGFTAATGGLLKGFVGDGLDGSSGRAAEQKGARSDRPTDAASHTSGHPLRVFLFAYPSAEVALFTHAWAAAPAPIRLTIAPGTLADQLRVSLGGGRGGITPQYATFTPQAQFDALLAAHDINIVRGEDSFIRAQLAGKPALWHIYRQSDDAHLVKLAAWLERYLSGAPAEVADVVRGLSTLLNPRADGPVPTESAAHALWAKTIAVLPVWNRHAQAWADELLAGERGPPDLAESLVSFISSKLE